MGRSGGRSVVCLPRHSTATYYQCYWSNYEASAVTCPTNNVGRHNYITRVIGQNCEGWRDGEYIGFSGRADRTIVWTMDHLGVPIGTAASNHDLYSTYLWNRVLTDAECRLISADPLGMFRRKDQLIALPGEAPTPPGVVPTLYYQTLLQGRGVY